MDELSIVFICVGVIVFLIAAVYLYVKFGFSDPSPLTYYKGDPTPLGAGVSIPLYNNERRMVPVGTIYSSSVGAHEIRTIEVGDYRNTFFSTKGIISHFENGRARIEEGTDRVILSKV